MKYETIASWHHLRTAHDLIKAVDDLKQTLVASTINPEDVYLNTNSVNGGCWMRLASRKLTDGSVVVDLVVP